jgi:hypothetical protein
LESLKIEQQIFVNISPKEADLAIVSTDASGNIGELNKYVLSEYGYSVNDLPDSEHLYFGIGAITDINRKPIILVVTIDGKRDTKVALEDNLYKALGEFRGWFRNKKLWLPLMGTGSGGLTLQESYDITIRVINRFLNDFQTNFSLIISLPNTSEARRLRNQLAHSNNASTAKEFVEKLNTTFYLAGAFWNGEDQAERFFDKNIWEKGHEDESYSNIIRSIKKDDIILLKSAFSLNSESILRVKGIGVVTESTRDGASVKVEWKIKDLNLDIPILGKYRRTIALVPFEDVVIIFSNLDSNLWEELLPSPKTSSLTSKNKIPGIISDSEKGNDFLGIGKDIRAFARVISAKSFEPPLAIALLGKWGSGKSFFMRKLKEQIEDFSLREANDMYCKGVVHIHFNAWSYMDANLWASFVSRIFEGLQEYIKNENIGEQELNKIRELLTNELNITKTNIDVLEEKKGAIEEQINLLEKKRDQAKKNLEEKITQLKKRTVWNVLNEIDTQFNATDKIVADFNANNTFVKTKEELQEIVPEKYWSNPEIAYEQAKSKYTFLKEFFKREKLNRNLICLSLIFFAILVIPITLELIGIGISQVDFSFPQVGLSLLVALGAIWKRAEVVYKKLQPVVASFWKIKVEYEQLKEEALAKFEQDEKVLRLEIEQGEEEVLQLTQQIQKVEIIATELEYKINNALASETLYSFIDERSKSDDYKKHLGIISIIRKDFEILNELFVGHNNEVVNQDRAEKFREYFNKPVERIILYIDDLDRCPEENVVQVLEAVNLLMAFPLFVVIVGVDPRWVKNALIKKYTLQFASNLNNGDASRTEIEQIEPSNYLEKIFQIPFHLKDASLISVKEMIRQLAITKPESLENTSKEQNLYNEDEITLSEVGDPLTTETNESVMTELENEVRIENEIETTEDIKFLDLSELEVELLQDMGEIIGANPRAIKRFVNIFKIAKAHEDFTIEEENNREELLAILFLLALSTGQFRCLTPSFETYIEDPRNEDKPMTLYLQNNQIEKYTEQRNELYVILSNNSNYHTLQNLEVKNFNKHNVFVKRFTFKSI